MYINHLDIFAIKIPKNESGSIPQWLNDEFADHMGNNAQNPVTVEIKYKEDAMHAHEYVVKDPVSYDSKGVYIFDYLGKKMRINFDNLGTNKTCVIECDPEFHPPFFAILIDFLVYVESLKCDKFMCHSSGVIFKQTGILCPAWRNIGKTNVLLSLMEEGADYIADDWALIDFSSKVFKIPKRIYLLAYNMIYFPDIANKIDVSYGPLLNIYSKIQEGAYGAKAGIVDEVRDQLKLRVKPEKVFSSRVASSGKIDFIFFLTKNIQEPERGVYIEKIGKENLIRKIIEVLRFEQKPFRLAYSLFKARTGRKNAFLEKDLSKIKKIAQSTFSDLKTYEVFTPGQEYYEEVKNTLLEVVNNDS